MQLMEWVIMKSRGQRVAWVDQSRKTATVPKGLGPGSVLWSSVLEA